MEKRVCYTEKEIRQAMSKTAIESMRAFSYPVTDAKVAELLLKNLRNFKKWKM